MMKKTLYFMPNFHRFLRKNTFQLGPSSVLLKLGFDSKNQSRRRNQVAFHQSFGSISQQALKTWNGDPTRFPYYYRSNRFTIDLKHKKISLTPIGVAVYIAIFTRNWLQTLFSLIRLFASRKTSQTNPSKSIVLVVDRLFQAGQAHESDYVSARNLILRLNPELDGCIFIFSSENNSIVSPDVMTAIQPASTAFAHCRPNTLKVAKTIAEHFKTLLISNLVALSSPSSICLLPDLEQRCLYKYLYGQVKEVFTTNSNCWTQTLLHTSGAHKQFTFSMLWYSTNNHPIFPTIVPGRDFEEFYSFGLMQYDRGYYWCKEQAEWAISVMGAHQTVAKEAIIFSQSPASCASGVEVNDKFTISIFDVTPKEDWHHDKIGFTDNYHSSSNMRQFIADISKAVAEIEDNGTTIEVTVKPKRQYDPTHCSRYISELEKTREIYSFFRIVEHNADLLEMATKCDMAISIPYTSPAILTHFSKKPSIYYDPTGKLVRSNHQVEEIAMLNSYSKLKQAITVALNNYVEKEKQVDLSATNSMTSAPFFDDVSPSNSHNY